MGFDFKRKKMRILPFLILCLEATIDKSKTFSSCEEIRIELWGSGNYNKFFRDEFRVTNFNGEPKWVECIFDKDGAWTVIQKRYYGHENFNRSWVDYKNGFGNELFQDPKKMEYWIGLNNIHKLTNEYGSALRIVLTTHDN